MGKVCVSERGRTVRNARVVVVVVMVVVEGEGLCGVFMVQSKRPFLKEEVCVRSNRDTER